jgi:cardiolipin synthase C
MLPRQIPLHYLPPPDRYPGGFRLARLWLLLLSALILALWPQEGRGHEISTEPEQVPMEKLADLGLVATIDRLVQSQSGASGAYVLETGDEALLARAWLVANAEHHIDIMTLIWSLDRIGLQATDALLQAADRGVQVRILVDDFKVDRKAQTILLPLALHPRIEVRIYNPVLRVGVSWWQVLRNVFSDFRLVNQRLHNKSYLVDGRTGITGGRNMANEYFDYDQQYNFRDRDILVVGPVMDEMQDNFERFWGCTLAQPIETLMAAKLKQFPPERVQTILDDLRRSAEGLIDGTPVVREALQDQPRRFAELLNSMTWNEIRFISDHPWKNAQEGLSGGGVMLTELTALISEARQRITIQSPYLILPPGGMRLTERLETGVQVRISTNSLAATDDIRTFSGYSKQRPQLLASGFQIREYRPDPAIMEELIARFDDLQRAGPPIFTLHAKTIVVDGETLFIGTFNIDPRAANLNTEEGIIVRDHSLARLVEQQIERDMLPENSWDPAQQNPDLQADWWRRFKHRFFRLFPLEPLL